MINPERISLAKQSIGRLSLPTQPLYLLVILFLFSCREAIKNEKSERSVSDTVSVTGITEVAPGQMPALTTDRNNNVHLVYGTGDSIMHAYSTDQGGTFSSPVLAAVVPDLAASHTRGPQIAATSNNLLITACNGAGDIFSFTKTSSGTWHPGARVNDKDTVAKENLMALAADGQTALAVWLDLRDRHNKIFGARSTDGGETWSKNFLIYASPDTTVCECCKPAVAIRGNQVNVMFRNWLDGNRDLYMIQSNDEGKTFGQAQKLGTGSWALNGCPMDGGNIVINTNGKPQTAWRRMDSIYSCEPGRPEIALGKGKNCNMETINGNNYYTWVENGYVICLKPGGEKIILGKGKQAVLKAVSGEQVICVWESDKQIHKAILL